MTNLKPRKFIWEEGQPPIYYRPGTYDEAIIQEVLVEHRAYLFPKIESMKTIFDIGANIGVATIAMAHIYPEAIIHCFEPQADNFELLKMNTEHLGSRVVLNHAALGNKREEKALLYSSSDPLNLGGYSTYNKDRQPDLTGRDLEYCTMVRMKDYIHEHGSPEIVKIDCEGSEFEILQDVHDLSSIVWITGELHGLRAWELLELLASTHDIQTSKSFGDRNWTFNASHKLLSFVNSAEK